MNVYVEGGGDSNSLRTECKKGFKLFLEKAGLRNRMPRIVACGSRRDAYNRFCIAINQGESAMLLVDSESSVSAAHSIAGKEQPWQHLAQRRGDQWVKPTNATDAQCHLMVECMEAWLIADRDTLAGFFGNGFNANALPAASRPVESISKSQLYQSLAKATRSCNRRYDKGNNSFELLALIDAAKVTTASPWAKRFVDELEKAM